MREIRVLTANESACVCAVANWIGEGAASALERFLQRKDRRLAIEDEIEKEHVRCMLSTFQIRVLRIQMN